MSTRKKSTNSNLEFWGGIECTINRVGDKFFDQFEISGHYNRPEDIQLIAGLGIKKLRYPVLWEKHQVNANGFIDWSATAKTLHTLQKNDITPIAGLLHHGSGPAFTSLLDDTFPELFADYARKAAHRFPWLQYYTPINEPLTTARFSGLYGLWYPHQADDVSFVKMLLNQVKGIVLAMREIRKVNPGARLIQTEDLSKTYSSDLLAYQAEFENERRWLTYDLLCGKVNPGHSMWDYLTELGITDDSLNFFLENATPPDVIGFNYYVTSERYLDENINKYPGYKIGGNSQHEYVDVEAIRVNHKNPAGLKVLLQEAWKRYKLPIAITEAHLNCGREDQLRWLDEIRSTCIAAIEEGIDIKAMTFWALFGSYGWNQLLTDENMDYEPGAFDLRSSPPRPTAIASFIKNSNVGSFDSHLLKREGWWHDPRRFIDSRPGKSAPLSFRDARPIMIIGKTGTLGKAFTKICTNRNLPFVLLGRDDLDITEEKMVNAFLDTYNPWAVINAAGYVNVDRAEQEYEECFKINTAAPILISKACSERGISFLTYSSDLVFDGKKGTLYAESDNTNPLNIYGRSKVLAEEGILANNAAALIVRTSAFFGPWDEYNFAYGVIKSLANKLPFVATNDITISPSYVPHLVTASLDLLVDGEKGIWHIANDGALTWKDFAIKIANRGGYDSKFITGRGMLEMNYIAQRPGNSAMQSQKGRFVPSVDHAVNCFFEELITFEKSNGQLHKPFRKQKVKGALNKNNIIFK